MTVYLDTGVFIDYLIGRSHAGPHLRSVGRRGRLPVQLGTDAEACFMKLAKSHASITSSLTCYEVEEAAYAELKRSAKGVAHGARYSVPPARAVMTQSLITIEDFAVRVVDLTLQVILAQSQNLALQMKGVRAADALHVTTALLNDADVLISADDDVLALDGSCRTISGKVVRCLDTDEALSVL